ncbi:MAG: hypothetical protein A3H06_02105 [Candidatus Colwellbacteria bacterium RIFCSPLOWO2_12_FULL_44_13]|uniref:Uncharacterized protein n=3 Tax=Candidatus Colwelliibacteriota TaxID=1817904 RepID=A0A1G1Z8H1_9BACT|nr:MAG: hypothetical protein A3F24_01535 [Candidatus Colwellbacteria bacterium RIFCSPHIGHO2_12_FULL_44_17]OGY60814.1 MAG: hypothetical protein A3I31_02440 [Candidatus Colwellbacteria bacterium RIFCSPLOWO2_02_FULL_44_20b]OGY62016.1 MAG: hypothetical protein A3H06_02105 [Candidatus Colwellbacteria bacterium RIFCSPLOWO2_12_FULL_44_13]
MSREISSISVLDYICKCVRWFHIAHGRRAPCLEALALKRILRLASESEDREICLAELRFPGFIKKVTSYLWEVLQVGDVEESLRVEMNGLIQRLRMLRRKAPSYYAPPSGS